MGTTPSRWDKIYKEKGSKYASPFKLWEEIIGLFHQQRVKKVLDVGCGSGLHLLKLAKKGFGVTGFDNSQEAISLAKKTFLKENLPGHFAVGNMHKKFPFPSKYFEAVISLRTLNHGTISQLTNTAKEISRVLNEKGLIFISVQKIAYHKNILGLTKLNGLNVKFIANRTYFKLEGDEKGIVHYIFNKKILLKLFGDFKILKFWVECGKEKWEKYCCLIGEKKF